MPRNTIQKTFNKTIVNGIIVVDGKTVPATYEIPKKCHINTAQAIVRKEEPSFSAISIEQKTVKYVMDYDTFKQHATIEEN